MPTDQNYWRSLRELHDGKSVSEQKASEFMAGVTDEFKLSDLSSMSRKQFLALLSASAAFAAAGCSNYKDKGEIVPYTKKPEEIVPGVANHYASTCTGCAQACGILIKTREGRPIKIDGNPDHPVNRGKVCAKGQASILDLYDPYRLRAPQYGTGSGKVGDLTWKKADAEIAKALAEASNGGKEIALLVPAITSPTTKKLFSEFAIMKSNDFNRLYCVEGTMSLTGANADHRLRLRPDAQLGFVLALLNEIVVVRGVNNGNKKPGELLTTASLKRFATEHALSLDVLKHLVDDLLAHRGKAIVHAGSTLPETVHIAVNYLNEILGNTAVYKKNVASVGSVETPASEFEGLVGRMKSGQVAAVVHFGVNPVYHLPRGLRYDEALKSVRMSISLTETDDETSRLCMYVLPANHNFESWGDHSVRTGVHSLQQPVIAPLYDTRQREAVLLSWMAGPDTYSESLYHQYLMNRWEKEVYPASGAKADFKSFWYSALHDGVVRIEKMSVAQKSFNAAALASVGSATAVAGFAVALTEHYYLGNGRSANNGWL
ncbi:MAG: TAT-variant-translocated molybdopterin oxidoreductase, partial [Bacteroidetes bacterium]|nr:TAT-variant-translocated molybdopterin oxidoreductase [Bacteroidota bacterium]